MNSRRNFLKSLGKFVSALGIASVIGLPEIEQIEFTGKEYLGRANDVELDITGNFTEQFLDNLAKSNLAPTTDPDGTILWDYSDGYIAKNGKWEPIE